MIIVLGIVGEIITVIGSIAIIINANLDSILEISKNGYKIDKKVIDEVQSKQEKENDQKSNLFNKTLLFIPGVNLIYASIKGVKLKKSIMNDPQIKEYIIPMTENEKEQYAKIKGKSQRLTFIALTSEKENEEEFLGFVGKKPIVVDHELTNLYYEELTPLDYTLEEVKKLNAATTYSYRIGKINGKNVAIIGIPNSISSFNKIQFKTEDYKVTHAYEKMTEDEAQDKTFTVYPFTVHDDTQANVEKIIQEIKQSRIDNNIESNSKVLETQSRLNHKIVSVENKETLVETQGPKLVKTFYTKK